MTSSIGLPLNSSSRSRPEVARLPAQESASQELSVQGRPRTGSPAHLDDLAGHAGARRVVAGIGAQRLTPSELANIRRGIVISGGPLPRVDAKARLPRADEGGQ